MKIANFLSVVKNRGSRPKRGSIGALRVAEILGIAVFFTLAHLILPMSLANSQAVEPTVHLPEFEIASIKPNKSHTEGGRMMFTPDGLAATDTSLQVLLQVAYGVGSDQIIGAPKWITSNTYDIQAKVGSSSIEELRKLSRDQQKLMLRPLLVDRFRLKFHYEIKQLPIYAMIIAKHGLKMREAKPGDTYPNGVQMPGGGAGVLWLEFNQLTGQAIPMTDLSRVLSRQLGRTVIDKTGLSGKYDFTLKWATDDQSAAVPNAPQGDQQGSTSGPVTEESAAPSIFTAVQEQLGLKLESQMGPVQVLVIDHIEEPAGN